MHAEYGRLCLAMLPATRSCWPVECDVIRSVAACVAGVLPPAAV